MVYQRVLTAVCAFSLVLFAGAAAANSVGSGMPVKRAQTPATAKSPVNAQNLPPALTDAQLDLAGRVTTGHVPCELAQRVSVQPHPAWPGHFDVQAGAQKFVMQPVVTTTGAIRLEDTKRGAVWLQLSNKSMLMDQRQGRRLADACMSPAQQAVALAMERDPAPGLLESVATK
jgi:hypothetical protein